MSDADPDLESLLQFLRHSRGFDFTGYKRATLTRRINKRMNDVHVETYGDYLDYLEVHPDEFPALFDTILINVTSFFRDRPAWDFLAEKMLAPMLEQRPSDEAVRVWSAACASGEEAYSIAIVLAELLGVEAFRRRVKIYATDVDDAALGVARHGEYPAEALKDVPEKLVTTYFEPTTKGLQFRADLRRAVIFGRQDLIQDAPISRLDLLICRNALMYFNAETQRRILTRFHFALKDAGLLFLGRAEMLLTSASLFTPANLRYRVFDKVPVPELRDQLMVIAETALPDTAADLARDIRIREAAYDGAPVASLVVNDAGRLVTTNAAARELFGLTRHDVGRSFHDLEVSYRPVELRAPIEEARQSGQPVALPLVERPGRNSDRQFLQISVTPVFDDGGKFFAANVTYEDVTRYRVLQDQLERSTQELETASEELQSTNEELETANEELQSTVEELETTNEELQSANEELETMNEELESTNEELQAINDELRQRTEDYDLVNTYLGTILASVRVGVVVVNGELEVQTWNRRAEDLWGLRSDEARGKSLFDLDIGLPVRELRSALEYCLDGGGDHQEVVTAAVNRRGRTIQCRVTATPLVDDGIRRGVVLLMEEQESETAAALRD